MEKVKSQNKIIADYLKAGNSIDSSLAYRICGTMNLAQRIYDLKRPPFNLDIDTKMVRKDLQAMLCTRLMQHPR